MKGFKLSKISWLILSSGVFLVILVGLGVTRSQQLKEQTSLDEELQTVQILSDKLQTADLQEQVQNLQSKIDEANTEVIEARQKLDQTVISADVDEKFFSIASWSNVEIMSITTSGISDESISGVKLSKTIVSANVIGDLRDIVNFVINLNNNYSTGQVLAVSMSINDDDEEETGLTTGSVQMTIYSNEE